MRAVASFGRLLDLHSHVVTNGRCACVVRSANFAAVVGWLSLAVFGLVLLAGQSAVEGMVGGAVFAVGAMSAISAVETRVRARRFDAPITHLLSDVVRFANSEAGSGRELTLDLRDRALSNEWVLGGEASNQNLLTRFYEPLGFASESKPGTGTTGLRFIAA